MKLAVFYYSQSGQALNVAKHICQPLEDSEEHLVVYKEIVPKEKYPFPWNKTEFFDTFPETRLGLPPSGIEPLRLSDIQDADIIMIVGQSWYLSPSLPLQSFFTEKDVKEFLSEREVIFVNACRNMWLMTAKKMKEYFAQCHTKWIGHIVLQDEAPNWVSAVTIVRWLLYGKKNASTIWPTAGIGHKAIEHATRFGDIIINTWQERQTDTLQQRLLDAGAIHYKPSILYLEKIAYRMFGLWAKFIHMKGGFRDKKRKNRVTLFYIYLLTVLFLLSPFAQLFFYLTYPFHRVKKNRIKDCNL